MNEKFSGFADANLEDIARDVVDAHYQVNPNLEAQYGESGKSKCISDAVTHLTYLQQAVATDSENLFVDYVSWANTMLGAIGIPGSHLREHLEVMRSTLEHALAKDEATAVSRTIAAGLAVLAKSSDTSFSFIDEQQPHSDQARKYLALILASKRQQACELINHCLEQDICSVESIYLDIFQPVQREVGRLWQTGKISVAQEHFCTAVTQLCMSQLYPKIFAGDKHGGKAVVTCAQGELHEIGVRMVADLLEINGWDAHYLGANVPANSVVDYIQSIQPQLVGISATITAHLAELKALITDIRAMANGKQIAIMVGGYPFNVEPSLWKKLGADGFAQDAKSAVTTAQNFKDR